MLAAWACVLLLRMASASQVPWRLSDHNNDWSVELSTDWNVLGPFPIHAREQHYLSPSFPLNLSEPVDYTASWPSSYADGGKVLWTSAVSTLDGSLQVSFPDIRWKSLRDTEGWAVLQHHAVLRTTLTIYPPKSASQNTLSPSDNPKLLIHLFQGSYFAVLPTDAHMKSPRWYTGDVYAMERALPHAVQLPTTPSLVNPTTYEIFVSGDYEIRLFGDPHVHGSDVPVQNIKLTVDVENTSLPVVREPSQDVVCNFVDGQAFGSAVGIGLKSTAGWWTVESVEVAPESAGYFNLELVRNIRIAPTQTRTIPLRISQFKSFYNSQLKFKLTLVSKTPIVFDIALDITQSPQWSDSSFPAIQGTYFYATSMPTAFLAIPPKYENHGAPKPPILALHGAGVDIIGQSFWADSFSRQNHSWIVLPSGRTSWGLDWHGLSAADAWESLDALIGILNDNSAFGSWSLPLNSAVIVMGHSNGGQGAWYLASRYPDRVLAVAPAAAYIKSQSYVPLIMSRSARYMDPALSAILESSLTPDNNDLFVSNLVDMPVFAIHGGNDENVPVWHSRELISILQTWNPNASAIFQEDPGKLHWYPTVLNNERVQAFLNGVIESVSSEQPKVRSPSFTLTVAIPAESGSLHGWRIDSLDIPGRIARLVVHTMDDGKVFVTSSNVKAFHVNLSIFPVSSLWVDNTRVHLPHKLDDMLYMKTVEPRVWKISDDPNQLQSSGRMQTILSSKTPLALVIPDESHSQELSIALRIAHDLHLYHRLDCAIIQSSEVFTSGTLDGGNVVVVGNGAATHLRNSFEIRNPPPEQPLDIPGIGILFLHPHPTNSDAKMLLLQSTDSVGLERAARLFPVRTGVPLPDWVIIGPDSDRVGAAGVVSAGVWSSSWTWNEPMSWMY